MLYLDEGDLLRLDVGWGEAVGVVRDALDCIRQRDFAQPIKPYLRGRDPKNRVIAMPAFVGGRFDMAGLKWIASFPGNVDRGLPRAHSVVILNDASTGRPVAIVNAALLSTMRTAAVSGLMLECYDAARPLDGAKVGITGFGPVGRQHLRMCLSILGPRMREACVFDPRPQALSDGLPERARAVSDWREAYDGADVFITCTVATRRYVDRPPKPGSLQLNVSLRDYDVSVFDWVKDGIVVDDWDEVCRESTDIELFHVQRGLRREDVKTLAAVVFSGPSALGSGESPIMFNPMGMGVFDVALATHCYRRALSLGVGRMLE